jgi:uncharacterized protein YxeA
MKLKLVIVLIVIFVNFSLINSSLSIYNINLGSKKSKNNLNSKNKKLDEITKYDYDQELDHYKKLSFRLNGSDDQEDDSFSEGSKVRINLI